MTIECDQPEQPLESKLELLKKENEKMIYRLNILNNYKRSIDPHISAIDIESLLNDIFDNILIALAIQWNVSADQLPPSNVQSSKQLFNNLQMDYQYNGAFQISAKFKQNPHSIATQICLYADKYKSIMDCFSSKGFINIRLSDSFINKLVKCQLKSILKDNNVLNPSPPDLIHKVIVDYSSPNIAKEMHVGHLRSTIIGESICRLFRYLGHDVLPINHLGDWGTQFGMLITHLQDQFPDFIQSPPPLSDLVTFYKQAKLRFDKESDFKRRSLDAVVRLQNREQTEMTAWKLLCNLSRKSFQEIYDKLDIHLIDRGESFYHELMPAVIAELTNKNLVEIEDNCKVLHLDKGNAPPLLLQKSDGGYTYDTSDMAAIKYRLFEDNGDILLYVVDQGQSLHLQSIFNAARIAGWYDDNKHRIEHVDFGVVLGEDGKKFKTRSGDTVCLKDLLDTGIERARAKLEEKNRHLELMLF